jgi:hypothetical protein
MILSHIEAAHRQLRLAVHLFFNGGDPVCIHSLACNAREIYETQCKERGVSRFFDDVQAAFPGRAERDLWNTINDARNFLKHRRKPPLDMLDFHDDFNVYTLLAASHDGQVLCGEMMPIESRVYLAWITATHEAMAIDYMPMGLNDFYVLGIDSQFPGLRQAPFEEKLRFGRALLECNLVPDEEQVAMAEA